MENCVFCKIVGGVIPSTKVYEDAHVLAVMDIFPATKGHVVVFPKSHHKNIVETPQQVLHESVDAVQKVAKATIKAMNAQGCRVQTNIEKLSGQSIFHLHWHIIPMSENNMIQSPTNTAGWTPQPKLYAQGEVEETASKIKNNF